MIVSPSRFISRLRALLQEHLVKEHAAAIAAVACALLVLIGWLMLNLGWLGLSLLILPAAYVVGGLSSAREGLTTLFQEKELDVDLLMIVAALGAAGLGLWRQEYYLIVDGAVLILIFSISGALEGYAMQRTERSIRGLMGLTLDTARVLLHGQEQIVPVAELQIGDQVLVKPGELVPADGLVIEGFSTLNQAPITGESMPVEKAIGDLVFAGTINGNGALRLTIHQPPESSLIQRVIRLVEQAQTEAPPSQQFIERFERGYAKVIVGVGLLLGTLPPFLWGWGWENTIYRALIFLVVASPCALMAAIMPTLLSGIANGARHGILFKNGAQLERIGQVRAIAFDKTGTLTTGKPQVVQVMAAGLKEQSGEQSGEQFSEQFSEQSEDRLLQIAAALESLSEHPIGEAIVQAARKQNLPWTEAVNVQAQTGRGIIGEIDQQTAIVGKAAFVQAQVTQLINTQVSNTQVSNTQVSNAQGEVTQAEGDYASEAQLSHLIQQSEQWEEQGKTVVWVAYAGQILGIIAVMDTVRPAAAQAIAHLKRLGVKQIVMLTGDNLRTAQSIAEQIGIDQVYAELLPEDKVEVVQRLQQKYQTVVMVGDGINDAPAIAQASVGVAMGTAGSNVALETADVVLMADRLEKLAHAICLGRRSQRIVKQNIAFALSFIVLLLAANFTGDITLPLGVLGHEGSTVIVTLSGLRLLRK